MTTTEQRLADALRASIATLDVAATHLTGDRARMMQVTANAQRETLATYDARLSRLPTDFRVTTEWDAFDATNPRDAAIEVWEKIKRSTGPVFTVYGRDGSITDVDLENNNA